MPYDTESFLVSFEELPLRLRLEGFPPEIAREIAYQWLSSTRLAGVDGTPYRVRLRIEPHLGFRQRSPTRLRRQVRLRARTVGTTTELRMTGARTRFTTGQPSAEVDVHPKLRQDSDLMELAVGGALGHALALAGACFLHGAAWVVDDLPVLLLGGPGSGKSTVAAAVLATGGRVISDDSLVLYPAADGRLRIRTLRRNLRLREGSLGVLPEALRHHLRPLGPDMDPRWVLPRDRAPADFRPTLEPAVLCVLRRDRRLKDFRLAPSSQAMAMAALLEANSSPHLLHPVFHGEQRRLLSLWSHLASSIPAFELCLGSKILDSPEQVLEEVVSRLRQM